MFIAKLRCCRLDPESELDYAILYTSPRSRQLTFPRQKGQKESGNWNWIYMWPAITMLRVRRDYAL